ncbi:hypothetical protein KAT82_07465 [bacterium]|nr:hypothetical protein [bacterium]
MNWARARRDVALRYVGRWMFVGPVLTLSMMGVIAFARFSRGPDVEGSMLDLTLVVLALWLPAAIYVCVTATERRCSRFDMELPISSRELWTAHTVALSIAGVLVLAATTGMLLFLSWAAQAWVGLSSPVFEPTDLALGLRAAAALLLSVALVQSVSPSLERIPGGPRTVWSVIGGIAVFSVLGLALALLPLAVSVAPVALAGWLVWRTLERLPGTMVVAPLAPGWFGRGRRADSGPPGAAASQGERETAGLTPAEWTASVPARSAARRLWVLFVTVFRSTTRMPVGLIVAVPMLLAAGFTMSGAFGGAVRGDDTIRFSLLFIISYTFLAFSGLPPRKLYMLDAFPLPRRFIFAAMFVPYVAILGLGYGAGRIVADKGERGRELITFIERDDHYYLSAPLRNGAIALDGSPPAAVAPWGESHEVWSRPIWAGKTPVVHSLFSTPPGSSPEFVAWQITRAAREIYGADIAAGEVLERYLTTDDGGRVVPVGGELTLAADHPDWRVSSHGPIFPAVMLLVCGLWFVALSPYLATLRPRFTETRKKGTFWWGMIALMTLHVLQLAAFLTESLDHWVLSGTSMIAVRAAAERLPGGSVTFWVLCGAVLYGLYRMAESRFLRVESLPGDDMRLALIERPIGAAGQEGAYAR